jgi:hypothetical protein
MNRLEFTTEMGALVALLIPDIADDYRAYDDGDGDDTVPSMLLTIGADANGWAYQTGDNSFTGGAYGYHTWAVVALYRDSAPTEVAEEIANEIDENRPDDEPIFDDESVQS